MRYLVSLVVINAMIHIKLVSIHVLKATGGHLTKVCAVLRTAFVFHIEALVRLYGRLLLKHLPFLDEIIARIFILYFNLNGGAQFLVRFAVDGFLEVCFVSMEME